MQRDSTQRTFHGAHAGTCPAQLLLRPTDDTAGIDGRLPRRQGPPPKQTPGPPPAPKQPNQETEAGGRPGGERSQEEEEEGRQDWPADRLGHGSPRHADVVQLLPQDRRIDNRTDNRWDF